MRRKKLSVKFLEKRRVPKVLIAGLILASVLGWTGWQKLKDIKNYYQIKRIFPLKTVATEVLDGDTFIIKNGLTVRLLGVDAPGRGQEKYKEAKDYLTNLLLNNNSLNLEYDQYQDDKFGRILAYAWIKCIDTLIRYCREGKMLVNEVMLKEGLATKIIYQKRKKLRYDKFLQ